MYQGPRNRNQGLTAPKERAALLAAILIIGAASIAVASSQPHVASRLEPQSGPLVFRTSDSQFDAGANNQGWWSLVTPNFDFNDNYVTGTATSSGGVETRNFFTFDLRSLDLSGSTIVSALLQVDRGGRGDDPTETLTLFEVSTDAATLNNNTGTSAAIFDDLGAGAVYGTYIVRFDGPQFGRATFRLNQTAIAAINGAAGGFFSIGGALQSLPGYLFAFTGHGDQRLVLCLDMDPDADGDGVCDEVDNCSATANPEQGDIDGDQIGDLCDDSDGDGILDPVDNCPFAFNPGQEDADADGRGDSCDFCNGPGVFDSDGDGVCNDVDNCRFALNPSQSDADGDGAGDECDNCPGVPNPDQTDTDNNGIGDACALCAPFDDFDADNVCDAADNCPFDHNPDQTDTDGDGFGDVCDGCTGSGQYDCEGDGVCDQADNCLCVPNPDQSDGDGEGVGDACDNCPGTPTLDQANGDGDAMGDACDPCPADPLNDLDGDGVCGNVDNCPSAVNPGQEDSDENGIGDACTGGRSLIVNSFADDADDRPGDGFCASTQNECTLRAAVQETNALFGADLINLPAGIYLLSLGGAGEDAAVTGDLDITDDLVMIGADPGTTVIDATFPGASPPDRAIEIIGSSQVEISGMTLRNGRAGVGGGIRNGDTFTKASRLSLRDCIVANNTADFAGGGIVNEAMLDLSNCIVENNSAHDSGSGLLNWIGATLILTDSTVVGNGGPGALTGLQGGGVNNRGTMTVVRSTVARNVSGSEGGAGIWNAGELDVLNSTISGNSANVGGVGGGIKSIVGSVRINSSTITDNISSGFGGGIFIQGGTVNVANTLIAANKVSSFFGEDCWGSVTSGGYNLIGDGEDCTFSPASGDLIGTTANPINPQLSPLQDHGGPTMTHALMAGSQAIDAGNPAGCSDQEGNLLVSDQRGVARILDGNGDGAAICDIGAFELAPPNDPPQADAGLDQIVECVGLDGSAVILDGSGSTDPQSTPGTNDDIASFEWFEDFGTGSVEFLGAGEALQVTLPLGNHHITLKVTDGLGASSTDEMMASVVDTTPPELAVSMSPAILWPPNHQMVPTTATVTTTDVCGSSSVQLVSVTSNEADDAAGKSDGNTIHDIQNAAPGTANFDVDLRAERDGAGSGRIYSLVYRASDSSGNTVDRPALVTVPHDQSGVTEPVLISVRQNSRGTLVDWNAVPGALFYDVIRGRLSDMWQGASDINLGAVTCIEASSLDTSTAGMEDAALPKPGEILFYLVQYSDGRTSSYGEPSTSKPRVIGPGGCR